MDADSCCWRRKTSYQCLSGLVWGRDEANHAGSCLCTRVINLLQPCKRATPWRMVTFSLWVKHRRVSEMKGRSYGLGEGWYFHQNISKYLPQPNLLIIWLLLRCKQYLKVFQPLNLKMSRKKKGTVWQEHYGVLPLLSERSWGSPRDTHVIVISHPMCSIFQRLFTLWRGKSSKSKSGNMSTRSHLLGVLFLDLAFLMTW